MDNSFSGVATYYQPGTTLFSTINLHGQIGHLSRDVPQPVGYNKDVSVPVIVLRILPAQLKSSHLYANLPQSNDFSSAINSVDIKALLTNYVNKITSAPLYLQPQPAVTYQQPEPTHAYIPPTQTYYEPVQQNVQQGLSQYHQSPLQRPQPFQTQKFEPQLSKTTFDIVRSVEKQPETYNFPKQYEIQEYEPPKQTQNYYQSQPYLPSKQPQQYHYHQTQQYFPPAQSTQNHFQAQEYVPSNKPQPDGLLTHENYPAKTHTRVIFKTSQGKYFQEILIHNHFNFDFLKLSIKANGRKI